MQGTCPNPECGAIYTLAPQNIGGQFACRKCGTVLRVESDGLHFASGEPAASPAAGAPARPSAAKLSVSNLLGAKMKFNIFDVVFGVGAVMVIVFTFFPILDQLHQLRYDSEVSAKRTEHERADRADRDAKKTVSSETANATALARQKEIQPLQDNADDHRLTVRNSVWFYGWGALVGFIILAVASLGWVRYPESRTHRVVGAVVLCAQLTLVFYMYMIGALVSTIAGVAEGLKHF